MILFCFIDHGPGAAVGMSLLAATEAEASLAEAQDVLRSHPGARAAHVFDGDMFVGTAEAPAFGFVGTNNTDPISADAAAVPASAALTEPTAVPAFETAAPIVGRARPRRKPVATRAPG